MVLTRTFSWLKAPTSAVPFKMGDFKILCKTTRTFDLCIGIPISCLLTMFRRMFSTVSYSVLNVKALVGAFNQEKAQVGAFSVIMKTGCGTDGSFYSSIAGWAGLVLER